MLNAKVFSVVDLNHGFWEIQLDEDSYKQCTFNTPFGHNHFKRFPFGFFSSLEVFQKYNAQRLEEFDRVVNVKN